jgi:hypothetical protein
LASTFVEYKRAIGPFSPKRVLGRAFGTKVPAEGYHQEFRQTHYYTRGAPNKASFFANSLVEYLVNESKF